MERNNIDFANYGLEGQKTVPFLYGCELDIKRACGYCPRHHCYLTVKMLKQHDCLNKQCWHLIKNEEHEWWQQRARTKAKRKERKKRLMGC